MAAFGRNHAAISDLERLKNYEELDSLLIRLEAIESNTSQHFPHWRDSIFSFQLSQWVDAIQGNNSLEQVTVDLSVKDDTCWRKRSMENFLKAVGAIPTLSRLVLRQNNLGSPASIDSVSAMAHAVENTRCLTHLELRWMQVRAGEEDLSTLANAIKRCGQLQCLTLLGNQANEVSVRSFIFVLQNRNLKKLCIGNVTSEAFLPFLDGMSLNTTLETMKVVFKGFVQDDVCERLAGILIQNTSLRSLSVLNCNRPHDCFGYEGYQSLMRMVEQNYTLQEVNVAGPVHPNIPFYVRLNRAGRRKLFNEGNTRKDWVNVLAALEGDAECLFHILLLNPSICAGVGP